MFHIFFKKKLLFFFFTQFFLVVKNPFLFGSLPNVILVTSNDGGSADGSLGSAILAAQDGDIIDCTPIAGETIFVETSFPAIGHNFSSPTSSLTILGQGVILDGGGIQSAFSLGYGSAIITGFVIQNGISKGGDGGFGKTGGGGGTGGGGALYIHSGANMIISAMSLNNNQAVGGAGGAGNLLGGSGGGGGGYFLIFLEFFVFFFCLVCFFF